MKNGPEIAACGRGSEKAAALYLAVVVVAPLARGIPAA